jgi:hypothetical protein
MAIALRRLGRMPDAGLASVLVGARRRGGVTRPRRAVRSRDGRLRRRISGERGEKEGRDDSSLTEGHDAWSGPCG